MTTILVEIQPRPSEHDETAHTGAAGGDAVEVVENLDEIVETTMCSCNAGDDNPY